MLECFLISLESWPVQFLTQVNNKLIGIAKMSTAVSHLCQYCCCSATVIYYYVRPCDVEMVFAGRSLGGQHGPALLSPDSLILFMICSVQHRWTLLTFSLPLSWFVVRFFVKHSCVSGISNLSEVDGSNEHLLHCCMMQCTELFKSLLPCYVHEAA